MANHPLQTSGQISFRDLNLEFGKSATSPFSMMEANDWDYGNINQYSPYIPTVGNNLITGEAKNGMHLTDWYGYNHLATSTGASISVSNPTSNHLIGCANSITNWTTARTVGTAIAPGLEAQASYFSVNGSYYVYRTFMGFNCTSVPTSITTASVTIYFETNNLNANQNYVLVKTTTVHPHNYLWGTGNFAESNGGQIISNTITIGPATVGSFKFTLNSTGIAFIKANANVTMVMVQYTNDYLNVAPTTNGGTPFSRDFSGTKLTYA